MKIVHSSRTRQESHEYFKKRILFQYFSGELVERLEKIDDLLLPDPAEVDSFWKLRRFDTLVLQETSEIAKPRSSLLLTNIKVTPEKESINLLSPLAKRERKSSVL